MAYAKKSTKNEAYQKLKTDLKDGNALGNAYPVSYTHLTLPTT